MGHQRQRFSKGLMAWTDMECMFVYGRGCGGGVRGVTVFLGSSYFQTKTMFSNNNINFKPSHFFLLMRCHFRNICSEWALLPCSPPIYLRCDVALPPPYCFASCQWQREAASVSAFTHSLTHTWTDLDGPGLTWTQSGRPAHSVHP